MVPHEPVVLEIMPGIVQYENSVSMAGLIFSKRAFGGITPFSRAMIALMTPASPLVPSKWPILDLIEPLANREPCHTTPKIITVLEYSHVKGLAFRPRSSKHTPYRLHLNRITNGRPGAYHIPLSQCFRHQSGPSGVSQP